MPPGIAALKRALAQSVKGVEAVEYLLVVCDHDHSTFHREFSKLPPIRNQLLAPLP
jgi:hypothetical protein